MSLDPAVLPREAQWVLDALATYAALRPEQVWGMLSKGYGAAPSPSPAPSISLEDAVSVLIAQGLVTRERHPTRLTYLIALTDLGRALARPRHRPGAD